MKLTRTLAALFVAASLSLATFVPLPSPSPPLYAAASNCGAYDGPICKSTTSCIWFLFGKICTTTYAYYQVQQPADEGQDGGDTQPELDPSSGS